MRLGVVARAPERLESLDIGPVVGELALEPASAFPCRELGLQLLDLARPALALS
jgi:hypothetical protein